MKTRTIPCGAMIVVLALAGCTPSGTTSAGNGTASTNANSNPYATRRMITGSHVPQPVDRPAFDNVSASAPSYGSGRVQPSLVPTEPTVGARGQSDYRLDEASTGAGPEGEPTVGKGHDVFPTKATPAPSPRATPRPKPKPTPTPTPTPS